MHNLTSYCIDGLKQWSLLQRLQCH